MGVVDYVRQSRDVVCGFNVTQTGVFEVITVLMVTT